MPDGFDAQRLLRRTGKQQKFVEPEPSRKGPSSSAGLFFLRSTGESRRLRLLDAAQENVAQPQGCFVVQTEMGILFHDIKCVAEFVCEFRLRCADRHTFILAGRSIAGFIPLFHRRETRRSANTSCPDPSCPQYFAGRFCRWALALNVAPESGANSGMTCCSGSLRYS